jgi:sirohydrochlorin ferrochelatase
MMSTIRIMCFVVVAVLASAASFADTGILLLSHGGSAEWNGRVLELARSIDKTKPVEVAFGMATRANIQAAVDRLAGRGVAEIVAVPLFVSSWSSVVTSTEYLLGLRDEAPPALAVFAKMNHPDPVASPTASHAGHDGGGPGLGATPVVSKVPITRMTPALNGHPLVAEILTTRARSISRNPSEEAVVIVAHGPTSDDENSRWLQDMGALAGAMARTEKFASIDYLTVRDDAPKPIRDAATAQLRALVSTRSGEGRRVLIVPLLLSFGGIERGIKTRLEGLPYTMADAALMPDQRLLTWVLEMAK